MTSFSGRAVNAALRLLVKRRVSQGLSVATVREVGATLDRWAARGVPAEPGDPVMAGSIRAEWFGPPGAAERPILLYLHGGGFMTHLPSAYRAFARTLEAALGARVLLPEYRLAPEHRFPAGADDCLDAYRWLLEQDFDPKRIVIAGDSAGGNLALVTAIRIRDEALPAPACVVMLSPATDFTGASASNKYNRDRDPLLIPEAVEFVRMVYAPGADPRDRWVSPLYDSFERLPPLLFHVGSTEIIVDDSIRAADKAHWAGVSAELEVWPDMPHVFQILSLLPEARAAIDGIARFARKHVPTRLA